MGFVDMGRTVEPFERAIFSIPLNQISDPIRSEEYGYHIVKVVERRPESTQSFEEAKPMLAAQVPCGTSRSARRPGRSETVSRVRVRTDGRAGSDPNPADGRQDSS